MCGDTEAMEASTRGEESCRGVSSMALDLCGADEGAISPNRGVRHGRRANTVGGQSIKKGSLCCRCRELPEGVAVSQCVRDLCGERRAQTRQISQRKAPR